MSRLQRGRPVRALVAAVVAAATLTGCGVRLDTPSPELPVADAVELARQDAASAAAELRAAAGAARASLGPGEEVGEVLTTVENAAAEHLDALGGMWEPWPGAGPEATAYPDEQTTSPPADTDASPADVLALLEESAAAAHAGAVAHAGELGPILASVAISRTFLAGDLAAALTTEARTLPAEPLPPPEPGTVSPDTSRALDAARYALEVVAARSSGDERSAAAERADDLAEIAAAVAPEEDRRDVAYDITAADDDRALAAAAELDVVRAHVASLAEADEDRDAVLAAATHAAGQARSWDGTLPALPGLS